jgi:hypothetical protein
LWLIEVDPHRGGSISLRPAAGVVVEHTRLLHFPRKLGPWELATQALLRLSDPALSPEWEAPESGM